MVMLLAKKQLSESVVGKLKLNFAELLVKDEEMKRWYPLSVDRKGVGRLQLALQFRADKVSLHRSLTTSVPYSKPLSRANSSVLNPNSAVPSVSEVRDPSATAKKNPVRSRTGADWAGPTSPSLHQKFISLEQNPKVTPHRTATGTWSSVPTKLQSSSFDVEVLSTLESIDEAALEQRDGRSGWNNTITSPSSVSSSQASSRFSSFSRGSGGVHG